MDQRGELAEDFTVPVEVRRRLSKEDSLRLATVEKLQRQNLTPLGETEALTKLVQKKEFLEDIATQTGLSVSTIRRRLALNSLCKEAGDALEGDLTLPPNQPLGRAKQRLLLDPAAVA